MPEESIPSVSAARAPRTALTVSHLPTIRLSCGLQATSTYQSLYSICSVRRHSVIVHGAPETSMRSSIARATLIPAGWSLGLDSRMEMLTSHVVSQAFGTVLVFSESPAVRKTTDSTKSRCSRSYPNDCCLSRLCQEIDSSD